MIRVVLRNYGSTATNLKVARRLGSRIKNAQRSGHCVLIDCEEVEASQEFLDLLLKDAKTERLKFCGLSIMHQISMAMRLEEREKK